MSNYIDTKDIFETTVICSDYQWYNHVASGTHTIMLKNKPAVIDTLNNPDAVFISSEYDERKVFFKKSSYSTYNSNKFYTKVIVGYIENDCGEVITAFPIDSIKGGIGNVIYQK